jgi:hypothetical protein
MLTAQELIEGARLRHNAFTETALGDGAAVRFLNQRVRTLLLRYKSALRSIANATLQTAAVINGGLVGIDALGAPYYLSTVGDGYPLHLDPTGIPYIDTTDPLIALDPFGAHGGTPGFPLPPDAIALFTLSVVYQSGQTGDVDVIDESERNHGPSGHNPAAFMSGNRVIPIRPAQPGGQDVWTTVTAVQLSYLPMPTVKLLTDLVALPTVLADVLIAAIAELFAMQSPTLTAGERAGFAAAARRAEQDLDVAALDIVGEMAVSSVIYEG